MTSSESTVTPSVGINNNSSQIIALAIKIRFIQALEDTSIGSYNYEFLVATMYMHFHVKTLLSGRANVSTAGSKFN